MSVKVNGHDVQAYLSGVLVATFKAHFAPRVWGGVFTFHGYKNVILFRKFQIVPHSFSSKRCAKVVKFPDYVKLDANHGRWPQDAFCQVTYLGQSTNYQLSVDLYNLRGSGGVNFGHPGVFFNAKDHDNYDFVYFRCEKCYVGLS